MKRIMSIVVAFVFFMTAGAGSAFAGSKNVKYSKVSFSKFSKVSYNKKIKDPRADFQKRLNELKNRYKNNYKDKEAQDKLLDDIAELKAKYSDKTINVFVNGQEIVTNEKPVLKNGKVLLPVKAITNGLKATFTYDPKTGTIVIKKGDITVTLKVGSNIAVINNTKLNLENKVELDKKQGAMIPLGLLAKLLNGKCEFDKDSGTVTVEDGTVSINDNTTGTGTEQFSYTGIWNYGTQNGAYGNDNHWSNVTGSSFQIKFYGTKIKLYGAKDPAHGIAYVSIDDTTAAAMDYYSDVRKDNTLIYESPVLPADKEHTLKVLVSGLKNTSSSGITVAADRVEITRVGNANLALNKTVTASSTYFSGTTTYAAINAVDGKADTRWSSALSENQWLTVDLGGLYDVARVNLNWEAAYAKSYAIQLSTDGTNWTNAAVVSNGDGAKDEVLFTSTKARYVRMLGMQRATQYGYSLYEMEVYSK
ncbi:MAG TPA: discoidin domain-containing protein [Clostridia bacterium]|nr:discoidin domain-containing protein [Clostridia bacterium]